jgi:hypothetical protein
MRLQVTKGKNKDDVVYLLNLIDREVENWETEPENEKARYEERILCMIKDFLLNDPYFDRKWW